MNLRLLNPCSLLDICSALAAFPDTSLSNEDMRRIPEFLGILATDETKLRRFLMRLGSFVSAEQLALALSVAAGTSTRTPLPHVEAAFGGVHADLSAATLYVGVSEHIRASFDTALEAYYLHYKTGVIDYLLRPSSVGTTETRMATMLPFLHLFK